MRRWLSPALLLAAALVTALAAGEILIRLAAPQQLIEANPDAIWRADSLTGYRHRESVDVTVNSGEGPRRFISDAHGYRVNSPADRRPDSAAVALLCLGDSFLEALAVESDQTIPHLLARQLQQQAGWNARAANAGMSGWNANHYYREARQALTRQRWDLGLIFLYAGNDLVDRFDTTAPAWSLPTPPEAGGGAKRLGRGVLNHLVEPLKVWLEARSHLFVLARNAAYTVLPRIGLLSRSRPREFFTRERASPRWEATAEVCARIAAEFAARGGRTVFVLLPTQFQVEEERFARYVKLMGLASAEVDLEQPNRLLARAFAERSLTLVDPLEHMRLRADQGERLYGRVDRHFTAAGHQAVAEYIYPYVEEILAPVIQAKRASLASR
ncbi:MAG: SGNH/GDSL hydrolase family protein [Candidatus Zixiibacteriota bacterium]|nr:MAG: SGNH/GDSL hydrolase family protein [candidate division Zixibacteria bacterium]